MNHIHTISTDCSQVACLSSEFTAAYLPPNKVLAEDEWV